MYKEKRFFIRKFLSFKIDIIIDKIGSPWSVFDNWHLKEQFKRSANRTELSQQLSKYILYAGLINLVLSPVIFLFAVIFCVFSYGDVSFSLKIVVPSCFSLLSTINMIIM